MNTRRFSIISALLLVSTLFSSPMTFAEEDPFPGVSTGSELPGTKIWSQPGVTQSQWEATDAYKAFSCPSGSGNGMGVDMNFTTSNSDDRWFAYCVKTWRPTVDINADANFRSAQEAAIAIATAESQAWNAANPGKQKCIQWGPIVHANGVSTASGGVCANPVAPGPGTTVKTEDAPTVEAKTTTPPTTVTGATNSETSTATATPATPDSNPELANIGSGKPFTRVLPGQLSTSQCPIGFQAANGIIVAIGTGTFTECWPETAWQAWRLGGSTWEQFKSSNGTYNVQAVIDLNAAIADLKSQAKQVAQTAADTTPGIQRCSKWSGYGQSGQECAYAFVAPIPGATVPTGSGSTSDSATATSSASDTSTVISTHSDTATVSSQQSSETSTVLSGNSSDTSTAKSIDPTSVKVTESSSGSGQLGLTTVAVEGTSKEISKLIQKIVTTVAEQKSLGTILTKLDAIRPSTYSKTQSLPNERSIEETAVSLTPDICSVKGSKVTSLKPGKCVFSYELVGPSGNSFTVEKEIVFKK